MAEHIGKLSRSSPGRLRVIGDWFMGLRDRLVTDPGFQRWSSRFPLTRPIARHQANAAFDLCAGFVYSQVLMASIRIGLLERVRAAPVEEADLVRTLEIPPDRARLLIGAAVALGLLSRRPGCRIGLGMLGASIAANPGISAMVEHHSMLYADIADPVALLASDRRDTHLRQYWSYASNTDVEQISDARVAPYSALMTSSQAMLADDILDAYPFDRHASVLDVGGGEGAFLLALARRFPGPALHLFDLPAVAARAAARFETASFGGRLRTTGGNFFVDPLPKGHDVMTLVRIVHDHDDDDVLKLFAQIRQALPPGGTLVIAEPMSGEVGSARVADVYFAFYLLAMGSGRPRSARQLTEMLHASGFVDVRPISTARPMLVSMISARVNSST